MVIASEEFSLPLSRGVDIQRSVSGEVEVDEVRDVVDHELIILVDFFAVLGQVHAVVAFHDVVIGAEGCAVRDLMAGSLPADGVQVIKVISILAWAYKPRRKILLVAEWTTV